MSKWTLQPQECEGTYMFDGKILVSHEVQADIPLEEINEIFGLVYEAVQEKNGLDYLQVLENEQGEKVFFIASANRQMIESGEFDPDDIDYHNCVLCYPHER